MLQRRARRLLRRKTLVHLLRNQLRIDKCDCNTVRSNQLCGLAGPAIWQGPQLDHGSVKHVRHSSNAILEIGNLDLGSHTITTIDALSG